MDYKEVKFVVVGGGTAGWITANFLRIVFPENKITVIESSDIGILGAGEGTTPIFVDFLKRCNISIQDFIRFTKATIKEGVKNTNWNGDGSSYHYPFFEGNQFYVSDQLKTKFIADSKNLNDLSLSHYVCSQNKIRCLIKDGDPEFEGEYALHFDAKLAADFLKKVGISKNVEVIDGVVENLIQDSFGNIVKIKLKNNQQVDCDFVFDCSGFSRLIIGKLFQERWMDHQTSLPVNRAMPFFKKNNTQTIPPYSETIAMRNGWVWKVPVQGRYGMGYVFDSSYASDDEIRNEIIKNFGDVDIPGKVFSFESGFYENTWIKNCIAIGLSSGFIEPMEATSIWISIYSLYFLRNKALPALIDTSLQHYKTNYNDYVRGFNNQFKAFVQLHYLTKRNDSLFWREYKTKNIIVDEIKMYKEASDVYSFIELSNKLFPNFDPWYVFAGVGFYPKNIFKKEALQYLNTPIHKEIEFELYHLNKNIQEFTNNSLNHYDFISKLLRV